MGHCLHCPQISLPAGYFFGISAASADTPDSFEVFKFVLTTAPSTTREEPQRNQPPPQKAPSDQQQGNAAPIQNNPSSSISSQEFAQLQNRIQSMSQSIENLFSQLVKLAESSGNRHQELVPKVDRLSTMDQRLQSIESTVAAIKKELESRDYQGHFAKLQESLKDTHSSLLEGLPQSMSQSTYSVLSGSKQVIHKPRSASVANKYMELINTRIVVSTSAPRMGFFLFVVVGLQVLLAGAYIMYKRRRANGPKKYL